MIPIYASKLYKGSNRKSKILAAMQNPINAPLVQQLEEYLGEEAQELNAQVESAVKDLGPADKSANDDTGANAGSDEPTNSKGSGSHSSSHGGGGTSSSPKLSEKFGADLDAEGAEAFDATQGEGSSSEPSNPDEGDNAAKANSSTIAEGIPIQAADSTLIQAASATPTGECINSTLVDNPVISLSGLAGELKGTLNSRTDTNGVSRVATKNNEVWIHYNDDINLNNIMSKVIEILTASNYYYLIFNRLARSENAIVFTISGNDTNNIMAVAPKS